MNWQRALALCAAAPFALVLLLFNINLWTIEPAAYRFGESVDDVLSTLDGLVEDLEGGAGDDMQALFPEGYVITHGIVGFALVDVALRSADPDIKSRALAQARRMEQRIDTEKARTIFPGDLPLANGAFYRGYRAWLRGGILLADPDAPSAEKLRFQRDCDEFASALHASPTPYLESYHGAAWPGDGAFIAASLALHDKLFPPKFEEVRRKWVSDARARLDPDLDIIPHAVSASDGSPSQPARGLSSVLMSRMLYEVDTEFAAEQYARTRTHFVDSTLGLVTGVKEYRRGEAGRGDVDSGPLVLGYSLSASTVGIAAALLHGDHQYADPALVAAHAFAFPIGDRYLFEALPVGEAFITWAKTTTPWVGPDPTKKPHADLLVPGWRVLWHLLSVGALALPFIITAMLRRRRRGSP